MRAEFGEDSPIYISKVLGEFPTEATEQLIPSKADDGSSQVQWVVTNGWLVDG